MDSKTTISYEQFVQSQILFQERVIADARAGKVFWCHTCECWVPMDEKREDPWGGDWPVCIDCLEESGWLDSLVSNDEYNEHLADAAAAMEVAARINDHE